MDKGNLAVELLAKYSLIKGKRYTVPVSGAVTQQAKLCCKLPYA